MYSQSLIKIALVVLVCASRAVANSKSSLQVAVPDLPSTSTNVVQDNFLGISWELFPMSYLWGESTDKMPDAMKNYLSNIRARMNNAIRIRIGGNGMDASTYVPDQTEMIKITESSEGSNIVSCDFGPTIFDVMNAMADTVGEMQFILGLGLKTPMNDTSNVKLVKAARDKLGSRLDALLLGNEPDIYVDHKYRTSYSIPNYISDIETVLKDLEKQDGNITDKQVIGGPSVCCNWDLSDVLSDGLDKLSYKYYTVQHYPQSACNGYTAATSNISYYLSHTNVGSYLDTYSDGIKAAGKTNVPVLMTEYNSCSCGGDPSVAPTFSTSLWAVDVALKGASMGFTEMYLHTRESNVTYDLFRPSSDDNYLAGDWKTGAIYYAELVVAEALSASSMVVDLNLDNSVSSPSPSVAAYAIYDGTNQKKSKLMLFNYAYPTSPGQNVTQDFVLPVNTAPSVAVRYLQAENITEQSAITWAGQTADGNGVLQGTQALDTIDCTNGCTVSVPGPGLALVWLDNGKIYQDNSKSIATTATTLMHSVTRTIQGALGGTPTTSASLEGTPITTDAPAESPSSSGGSRPLSLSIITSLSIAFCLCAMINL